jgi:hypothetical protein
MKKCFLMVIGMALAFIGQTQSIANAGFEEWTTVDYGSNPEPFSTENLTAIQYFGTPTVFQSNNAHGGSFAAELICDPAGIMPGIIYLGDIYNQIPYPFSGNPDSLSFYYMANIEQGDFGIITIQLYSGGFPIAYSNFFVESTTTAYTYMSIPILYTETATVDGIILSITTSSGDFINSSMTIDDVHVVYNGAAGDDIPGGDFENWVSTSNEEPAVWQNSNSLTTPNFSVTPGEPHSGARSVRIENQTSELLDGAGYSFVALANINGSLCDAPAVAFSNGQVATSVQGYYKFESPFNSDLCSVLLAYYRFNDMTEQCDSILEWSAYLPVASEWTAFSVDVPVNFIAEWNASGIAPGSLAIAFSATQIIGQQMPNGTLGAVMHVDDLSLQYTTVGIEAAEIQRMEVFPNPASTQLSVQWPVYAQRSLELVDALGNSVAALNIYANRIELDTVGLSNGVYSLRIRDEHSTSTQLVVIQH